MSLSVFATAMHSMAASVPGNIVNMQRGVALAVVEHVSQATPVDTGQAAGNWKTSLGSANSSWDQGPNVSTRSYADAKKVLATLSHGQDIYISNNVPYIALLNAGYSNQAPSLFVETSIVSAIAQLGLYRLIVTP